MKTLFLRYPRLLVLAIGVLMASGLGAAFSLPRLEDPKLTNRNAVIVTQYPGADAERVEALVTEPIEDALRTKSTIDTLTSTSRAGVSVVSIELEEDIFEPEPVWSELRDEVSQIVPFLPAGASVPDFDEDRGEAYTFIAGLRWVADGEPNPRIMRRYAEALQDRLRNVPGTDLVRLFGDTPERITVTLDPAAAATAGLGLPEIAAALASADAKSSAGTINSGDVDIVVEVGGAFRSVERIRNIPLTAVDGTSLRLTDIADVERGFVDPPAMIARLNGLRGIAIASRMEATQRVDLWTARTKEIFTEAQAELPAGLELVTVFDQSIYTEDRLDDLIGNLQIGLMIVFGVLLVSMGWRSAIIVGFSLPLTAMMALGSFQWVGVEIHQMSVTGIIVALGLMVDNAIVMTNGIRNHVQGGMDRREAVAKAVGQFATPLLASTITTIIAFMPIVLMPGAAGEFVGPLSMAVILSLISSYAVAMTIVPALAGLLSPREPPKPSYWREGLVIPPLAKLFSASIASSMKRPALSVLAAFLLPLLGFVGATTLSEQFFPPSDRDQFYIELRTPEQSSITVTAALVDRVDELVRNDPDVLETHWFTGGSAPSFYYNLITNEDRNPSFAQALVQTRDALSAERLLAELQPVLDQTLPEAQSFVRKLEQGPPFDAPIELRIFGPDLTVLRALGEELRAIVASVPDITHVRQTLAAGDPKIVLQTDEVAARMAGLTLNDVAGQLDSALRGRIGGSIIEATEELPVEIRLPADGRSDLTAIRDLTIIPGTASAASSDGMVGLPLSALGTVELVPAISAITRRNGERVQEIKGYLDASVLPADALIRVQAAIDAAGFQVPSGYRLAIGGEAEKRGDAIGNLLSSVLLLMVLMISTVVLSFNSFRLAGLILLAAVQAMGLGLLSLTIAQYPMGFVVIVGLMGLVGLAINATIVILAALRDDPEARQGDPEAIRRVVVSDTSRHIVSTALTTMGGFLPLILTQGGFWPPFAVAIAGGTGLATVIAFYFTPAAYRLITARKWAKLQQQRAGHLKGASGDDAVLPLNAPNPVAAE